MGIPWRGISISFFDEANLLSMAASLGIIGAGEIGQRHVDAASLAGATVLAVADADPNRAQSLAQRCGGRAAASAQDVWNDPRIDAVVIGVPNYLHCEFAIAALRAGKDVLLEKPMALNAAQCDDILAAARAYERILQIGFVHRYTSVARTARTVIDSGELGRVYHAKAHLHLRRNVPGLGRWFTDRKRSGGGALIDVGVHLIDLSLWLLGFPSVESVSGRTFHNFGRKMRGYHFESMWGGPPDYEGVCDVEDAAHALIVFEDGGTLDLHVAWAGNFPAASVPASLMGIFGEQGGITFELFGNRVHRLREEDGALLEEDIDAPEVDFFAAQMEAFLQSVATRTILGPTGQEAQRGLEIVDAIYAAPRSTSATHAAND
jgi:predicted dehydrogenase